MSETRADGKGEEKIPDEEFIDGRFGDMALFPCDFGVHDVSKDGGGKSRNEGGEPEKVAVSKDEISKDSVKNVVENSQSNADENITDGVLGGFGIGPLVRVGL